MRLPGLAPLLVCLLPACSPVSVSGEISSDGTCSGAFDGVALAGPAEGVRVVARPPEKTDTAGRHLLVVYCLLSRPGEAPARIDFVKLDAPDTGVLEVGSYVIDRDGDQPRSIGVVVTAPEYLDGARNWQPTSGTLRVDSSTATTLEATFEMELRSRGAWIGTLSRRTR